MGLHLPLKLTESLGDLHHVICPPIQLLGYPHPIKDSKNTAAYLLILLPYYMRYLWI
jgi:hypothetical protein